MQIELIGVVAIILGLISWWKGEAFAIFTFMIAFLFGASAALILTAMGGANIGPSHLLLCFLALTFLVRSEYITSIGEFARFPRLGFWLLITVIYGVLSAVFFPRIFSGMTYVFGIARTVLGPGITMTPLSPSSGNITQTIYFIGDAVCFFIFYAFACKPYGVRVIALATLYCAAGTLCFAVLDVVTFWTHTADYLSFMRNASYRILDNNVENGLRRISGSFSEASVFAGVTSGWFAFCVRLWMSGIYSRWTGILAILSFGAVILSTSSTGYLAVGVFLAAVLVVAIARVTVVRAVPRNTMAFVLALPVFAVALILTLRLSDPLWASVTEMTDKILFYKLNSDSGVERMRWNQQAMMNFFDTQGFGAGVGSVRASSFPVAVLSNIGVIGAITYSVFLCGIFIGGGNRTTGTFEEVCRSAGRWACFTLLSCAMVAGGGVDLGLQFFLFAGLACSRTISMRAAQPVSAPSVPDRDLRRYAALPRVGSDTEHPPWV